MLFVRTQKAIVRKYDAALMRDDMEEQGYFASDLARRANVSNTQVGRFLKGERQTPKMGKKLADALGMPVRRYLIRLKRTA